MFRELIIRSQYAQLEEWQTLSPVIQWQTLDTERERGIFSGAGIMGRVEIRRTLNEGMARVTFSLEGHESGRILTITRERPYNLRIRRDVPYMLREAIPVALKNMREQYGQELSGLKLPDVEDLD